MLTKEKNQRLDKHNRRLSVKLGLIYFLLLLVFILLILML